MSKQSKSQWDFGELFPTEQTRQVLSVSDLTSQIRRLLEQRVGAVWVGGEVSNLRAQSSGHIYFTLKDAGAQLSCVCFRDAARGSRALLADGQQVILQGDVTVYEVRGQYQLVVRQIELRGVGALQIAFEKLKLKLAAEGLFAPERKRPLPEYPQRIGLDVYKRQTQRSKAKSSDSRLKFNAVLKRRLPYLFSVHCNGVAIINPSVKREKSRAINIKIRVIFPTKKICFIHEINLDKIFKHGLFALIA